jgi:hypothetical protein
MSCPWSMTLQNSTAVGTENLYICDNTDDRYCLICQKKILTHFSAQFTINIDVAHENFLYILFLISKIRFSKKIKNRIFDIKT